MHCALEMYSLIDRQAISRKVFRLNLNWQFERKNMQFDSKKPIFHLMISNFLVERLSSISI